MWQGLTPSIPGLQIWCSFWDASRFRLIGRFQLFWRLWSGAFTGACIGIFPEAHIWPFYTGVRPFVGTSFRYPVKLHAPVVAMAVTYRKRRGLFCWVKRPPGMTVTFSAPMYPRPLSTAQSSPGGSAAADL